MRNRITVYVPTKIKVDISKIMDIVSEAVSETIDIFLEDEVTLEDENIVVSGVVRCPATYTYFPQTMESPREEDIEPDYIKNEDDIQDNILENMKDKGLTDFVKECYLEIDYDDVEPVEDDYEPDPDMMPGGYDWLKDHEGEESYDSRGDWLDFGENDYDGRWVT